MRSIGEEEDRRILMQALAAILLCLATLCCCFWCQRLKAHRLKVLKEHEEKEAAEVKRALELEAIQAQQFEIAK